MLKVPGSRSPTRGGLGLEDWLGWLERSRAMAFEEVMA
jgi:hypothetical protein